MCTSNSPRIDHSVPTVRAMPTASTARSTTDAGVPGVAAINWPAPSHTTHGVSLIADHADNSAGSGAERVATAVSFLLISIAACSSWCSCRAMTSNTHFVMAMNGVSSGTVNNGTSLPLWIVLTCGVLFGGVTGTATATGGFSFVAFLVQFSVAASYNITYAPYVSDYSRYLPRTSDCAQSSGTTHPRRPDEVPASGFRRQSSLPASRFRHRTRCRQRGFPGATFLPQEADGVIGSLGRGARCHFWHLADGAIHIRLRLHRPNVGFPTHSLDPTTATPSPR